jgi:hypothetical protein
MTSSIPFARTHDLINHLLSTQHTDKWHHQHSPWRHQHDLLGKSTRTCYLIQHSLSSLNTTCFLIHLSFLWGTPHHHSVVHILYFHLSDSVPPPLLTIIFLSSTKSLLVDIQYSSLSSTSPTLQLIQLIDLHPHQHQLILKSPSSSPYLCSFPSPSPVVLLSFVVFALSFSNSYTFCSKNGTI